MTPQGVDEVASKQKEARELDSDYPDPLSGPPVDLSIKVRVFVGVLAIAASGSAAAFAWMSGDTGVLERVLAGLASPLPLLGVVRLLFGSSIDEKRLNVGRWLRWLAPACCAVAIAILFDHFFQFRLFGSVGPWILRAAGITVAIALFAVFLRAEWRLRRVWFAEMRADLTERLVAFAASTSYSRQPQSIDEVGRGVLERTAALLAVNLWDTSSGNYI